MMNDKPIPASRTSKTYAASSTKYTRSPQRAEAKLHRVAWLPGSCTPAKRGVTLPQPQEKPLEPLILVCTGYVHGT